MIIQPRVCLLNDSFPPVIDGVSNATFNYASIISKNYGNVVVGTPKYPGAQPLFDFPVVRYPSVRIRKITDYRTGVPIRPSSIRELLSYHPNIIHTHCPFASIILARTLRNIGGAPIVITYHTKFDIEIANAFDSGIMRSAAAKFVVSNIAECDEVWTVSHGASDNLRKLGYTGEMTVMENGVDFPKGAVTAAQIERVTRGLDLPAGVPVFLFVGRMRWYKGIRIILDALFQTKRQGVDFRMVFVGGGGDFDEIKKCAATLGLANRCVFTGPVHDRETLRAYFCRADIFLFPSTFDTNGIVVREAAACALASVLITGSAAAEGVTDGVNGLLIEENSQSLASRLMLVANNPDLARSIGKRAQETLYISWEDSVKRAYARYEHIIEKRKLSKRRIAKIAAGRL